MEIEEDAEEGRAAEAADVIVGVGMDAAVVAVVRVATAGTEATAAVGTKAVSPQGHREYQPLSKDTKAANIFAAFCFPKNQIIFAY